MHTAKISVEPLVIPTYPEGAREEMPMFVENRVHQRSTGRVYPCKATVTMDHEHKYDHTYTAVHLENDYLDVWILPEIGGRIFSAQDKSTGYDFFYRQHVIKPALIGALGSWISGGVEFNWPYHHRPSGYLPCDFTTEECDDGSVICWLSEHDPADRMKGMVGVVLRPDSSYIETRMKLTNRTAVKRSFLWWENAAVPVNEQYQIFFPHDVSYVNFHYLNSRVSYPMAGDTVFNGIVMKEARDISMHKNTRDATSYFACASKYDFFGGYDHGKECGVVHVADHGISPGKKMFTWAYNQLSKSWEKALTDTDGQYAELMAGSYTDNQPNFSWLDAYETKEFSQYWYPIQKIGTPDFANLLCAMHFSDNELKIQATEKLGLCSIKASVNGRVFFSASAELNPSEALSFAWEKPVENISISVENADGVVAVYTEEAPDELKMLPLREAMPLANEVQSADELYLAGVHVDQYRDPAVMPDVYWLEALKRNPCHVPSLLGMARYDLKMLRYEEACTYCEKAISTLTKFNERLESGEPYYLYALVLEAMGETDKAYDYYYKASWCADTVSKAMTRIASLDLYRGNKKEALRHADWALKRDILNPLAPVVKMLAMPERARTVADSVLRDDKLNQLVRYLSGVPDFFESLRSEASQTVLDMLFDLSSMGQYSRCVELLEGLIEHRPEQNVAMISYALAYYRSIEGKAFSQELSLAETLSVGDTYPSRPEEAAILRFAIENGCQRAKFLLGCLLYDKRHYGEAAALFEEYVEAAPSDYMGWRCLSVACFSHLGKGEEALELMKKALELCDGAQLKYEAVSLMDKLGVAPEEKIGFLTSGKMELDNLFTELAKAHNQNNEPEKALEVLNNHVFIPCEGGEHAIADQYMFAYYLLGKRYMSVGDYENAKARFTDALTLPENLGAGIWAHYKYIPYNFAIAECDLKLGLEAEAKAIFEEIVSEKVDFFSEMHLKEMPYYQAMSARYLGNNVHAQNLLTQYKREWRGNIGRKDNGFFSTTPFFISYVDDPAKMRRALFQYLCGLIDLADNKPEKAAAAFRESYMLNNENMFCGYMANS